MMFASNKPQNMMLLGSDMFSVDTAGHGYAYSGGSRISGRGGGLISIFISGGGYWRGRAPPGLGERCKLPQWGLGRSPSRFFTFAFS